MQDWALKFKSLFKNLFADKPLIQESPDLEQENIVIANNQEEQTIKESSLEISQEQQNIDTDKQKDILNDKVEQKNHEEIILNNIKTIVHLSDNKRFNLRVAGAFYYRDNIKKLLSQYKPQYVANLSIDSKNAYDKNAIKVTIEGLHIGFLEKNLAEAYRKYMVENSHDNFKATCNARPEKGYDYTVYLDLGTTIFKMYSKILYPENTLTFWHEIKDVETFNGAKIGDSLKHWSRNNYPEDDSYLYLPNTFFGDGALGRLEKDIAKIIQTKITILEQWNVEIIILDKIIDTHKGYKEYLVKIGVYFDKNQIDFIRDKEYFSKCIYKMSEMYTKTDNTTRKFGKLKSQVIMLDTSSLKIGDILELCELDLDFIYKQMCSGKYNFDLNFEEQSYEENMNENNVVFEFHQNGIKVCKTFGIIDKADVTTILRRYVNKQFMKFKVKNFKNEIVDNKEYLFVSLDILFDATMIKATPKV